MEAGLPVLERIAGLLAIIATRDMDTDEAAIKLDAIGLSGREIAGVLGVSESYAGVAKFRAKDGKPKAKKTKKKA